MLPATGAIPRIIQLLASTANALPASYFDPAPNSGFVRPKRLQVVPNAA